MPLRLIPDGRPLTRLAGLDNLRALAIVCVMLFHLCWLLPQVFFVFVRFGWMGVDLFFVLSGYLIGLQLLKPLRAGQSVELLGFYRRRAYRILPAYFVVLALYVTWPAWHEAPGMSPLWQFLTFTQNLFADEAKGKSFAFAWSLCVEEHFYLLLPLVVLWLARRPSFRKTAAVLSGFVVLGLAARGYVLLHVLHPISYPNPRYVRLYMERIYYPTWSRLDGLLAGVSLALARTFRPQWWTALAQRANWLLATGAVLVGVSIWMFYDRAWRYTAHAEVSTLIGFPLLSLGLAMWIPAAADARCWFARMRIPGARLVSMLAFSLYLTHAEIAHLVHGWFPQATAVHRWRTVPIYALSCVAAAALLYYGVERPFLRLRDRREGRGRANVDLEARTEPAL